MKARLPISSKHKKRIRQEVDNYYQQAGNDMTRRVFKLWCVSSHELWGFSGGRLSRQIRHITKLMERAKKDPVFWYHIDKECDQMGLPFEHEDYEVMDE